MRIVCWLLTLVSSIAAAAEDWSSFRGSYTLTRNGERLGSAELSVERRPDGRYEFRTASRGEGGFAGTLLNARIEERSIFEFDGGQFRSLEYHYRQRMRFRNRSRDIAFDWAQGYAHERDGRSSVSIRLLPGTIDRHLAVLRVAEELRSGRGQLSATVAYKGEISTWEFAALGTETIATGEGVLEAVKIERLQKKKDRLTRSWHAPALGYLPIQIEHIEPDGERWSLRLERIERSAAR
jgi:hypothetical protein